MVGTVVDNYRILEVLGAGGMGVVYKAVDTSLDKVVALKVMNPRLLRDDRFLRRFKAEARALGRLQHPHIVNVFAFRKADPFLLIVTEYIQGGTLTDLIKRHGPLTWQAAVPIMRQSLNAIVYAHRQQIIHRDIKPGNILLTRAGAVKVTDFGLAKIQAHAADRQGGTSAEFTAGTLCYMPPEQLEGLANVDQRGDIYALGMTFYEMLAGRTPFASLGSGLAVQQAIVAHDFPSLDQVNQAMPAPLVQIVTKAIEREPADRYPSVAAMGAALDAWAGPPGSAGWPHTTERKRATPETTPRPAITKTQHVAAVQANRGRPPLYAPRSPRLLAFVMSALLLVSLLLTQDVQRLDAPPDREPLAQPRPLASEPLPVRQEAAPSTASVPAEVDPPSVLTVATEPVIQAQRAADQSPVPGAPSPAFPDTAGSTVARSPDSVDGRRSPTVVSDTIVTVRADTLARGTLRVKPSPWGNVYVGGEPRAYEIDYWYALNLPARRHRVTVRNPVLDRTWTAEVDLAPGDTQDVVIDFMARVGVNVAAKDTDGQPITGEIYVDGHPTGDWSPKKVEVYPGLHSIEVRAAGYTQLEVREARGEASLPLETPTRFHESPRTRIVHAILKKVDDG